jgi:pimeloyl-ACP methyl ester carboxylesterase
MLCYFFATLDRLPATTVTFISLTEIVMSVSKYDRRQAINRIALGATATAVLMSSGSFVSNAHAQSSPKTFVLVPGAFLGAWAWRRVSDLLTKQGHTVYSVSLTGLADRSHLLAKDINLDTHIADIANLFEWEDLHDVCLVAHSYGGYPASGALERIEDRVSSIVWVETLKPSDGQKFTDEVVVKFPEGTTSIPSPKTTALPNPKDSAWMVSKMTAQPIATWLQPVKLSGAREKVAKKTFIRLPKYTLPALEPIQEELESDESVVIPCLGVIRDRRTRCGSLNTV